MSQSMLAKYMSKEQQLQQLQQELEALRNNETLQSELEFREKLEALMAEYGHTTATVITMLDPNGEQSAAEPTQSAGKARRKPRRVKVYRNPETGEEVKTRGGNHKTLNIWKSEHGKDVVESWVVDEYDSEEARKVA